MQETEEKVNKITEKCKMLKLAQSHLERDYIRESQRPELPLSVLHTHEYRLKLIETAEAICDIYEKYKRLKLKKSIKK